MSITLFHCYSMEERHAIFHRNIIKSYSMTNSMTLVKTTMMTRNVNWKSLTKNWSRQIQLQTSRRKKTVVLFVTMRNQKYCCCRVRTCAYVSLSLKKWSKPRRIAIARSTTNVPTMSWRSTVRSTVHARNKWLLCHSDTYDIVIVNKFSLSLHTQAVLT